MPKCMGHQVQMGTTLLHNATGMTTADGWEIQLLEALLIYCRLELSWTELCWLHIITTCGRMWEKVEKKEGALSSKGDGGWWVATSQTDVNVTFFFRCQCCTSCIEGYPSFEANGFCELLNSESVIILMEVSTFNIIFSAARLFLLV